MIIIDDKKFKFLKDSYSLHYMGSNDRYPEVLSVLKNRLILKLQEYLEEEHGLLIDEKNFEVIDEEYRMITCVKINKNKIALWDRIEEVLDIPSNFSPPLSIQTERDMPRVEEWGGARTSIPYDVKQYWPWGYDLERNIQIWKQR